MYEADFIWQGDKVMPNPKNFPQILFSHMERQSKFNRLRMYSKSIFGRFSFWFLDQTKRDRLLIGFIFLLAFVHLVISFGSVCYDFNGAYLAKGERHGQR